MSHARSQASGLAWQAGRFRFTFERPLVMGIVNATPDSFFDGGRGADAACQLCDSHVREGADVLDVGGESTRPGAKPIDEHEELARVLPVIRHAVTLGVAVSVDTRHARVMEAALESGADVVNDVQAFQGPGSMGVVARHPSAGACLMHMRGLPQTMQLGEPTYGDVVDDVKSFLQDRVQAALDAGIARERLCVDPGIGFGKTHAHNLALLQRQAELKLLGLPVLVGWSRKSTLGAVTGRDASERLPASLAAALLAVVAGANIVRVHDVAATCDALKVWHAVRAP